MKKKINLKKILFTSTMFILLTSCALAYSTFVNETKKSKGKKNVCLSQPNKKSKKTNSKSLNKNNISKNKKTNNKHVNIQSNKPSIEPLKYNFSEWNKKAEKLIVINKNNKVSDDLVKEIEKNLKYRDGKPIWTPIYHDLCEMFDQAKKDGVNLWVCSGYRSPKYQKRLFDNKVKRVKNEGLSDSEAEKKAEKEVAKPWHSEHNTGLAIDINCADSSFSTSKQYTWLKNNAHKFGFIERYLPGKESVTGCIYEPWHWRYVGKEVAEEIKNSGLSLEEFVIYNRLHLFINPLGK